MHKQITRYTCVLILLLIFLYYSFILFFYFVNKFVRWWISLAVTSVAVAVGIYNVSIYRMFFFSSPFRIPLHIGARRCVFCDCACVWLSRTAVAINAMRQTKRAHPYVCMFVCVCVCFCRIQLQCQLCASAARCTPCPYTCTQRNDNKTIYAFVCRHCIAAMMHIQHNVKDEWMEWSWSSARA